MFSVFYSEKANESTTKSAITVYVVAMDICIVYNYTTQPCAHRAVTSTWM